MHELVDELPEQPRLRWRFEQRPLEVAALPESEPEPVAAPTGQGRGIRRSVTLSARFITQDDLRIGALLWPGRVALPVVRGECKGGSRPCPLVRCRHHLGADINDAGNLVLRHADRELWEIENSCSLDVADDGPHTLQEVATLLGVTRERVRQIETSGLAKVRRRGGAKLADAFASLPEPGEHHLAELG